MSMSGLLGKYTYSTYSSERISILTDILEVYKWIANPTENLEICLNGIKKYNFPITIILHKLIQVLKQKNMSDDDIFNYITVNLIDVTRDNRLKDMSVGTIQSVKVKEKPKVWETCELLYLADNSVFKKKNVHTYLPHPDPVKGRPCFELKECYYYNCHEKFSSNQNLWNHLQNNITYRTGYHLSHEMAVHDDKLTSEIINEKDIKVCPSRLCKERFDDSNELIHHLKILGIHPFFNVLEDNYDFIKTFDKSDAVIDIKNVFKAETCIVCCDLEADVLFDPCMHSSMCMACFLKYKNKECPECRKQIVILLPN